MSLLNLLTLNDDEIDIATTVLREWCARNQTDINSNCGRAVMAETVRLILSGEKSPPILLEAISRHIQLTQLRDP